LRRKETKIFLQRGLDRQITFQTTPAGPGPDRKTRSVGAEITLKQKMERDAFSAKRIALQQRN
jgi:hypothetical protein